MAIESESRFKDVSKTSTYLATWEGSALTSRYPLDELGYWIVYGEDPNCDLGGHHSQPLLCVMFGRLSHIIDRAVVLPGFWKWGQGGSIKKIEVLNATPDVMKPVSVDDAHYFEPR
jgi:hypothetical protein